MFRSILLTVFCAITLSYSQNNLLVYYPFDNNKGQAKTTTDSAVLEDLSPNQIDQKFSGPTWTRGKAGQALDFDGVDDCIQNSDTNDIPISMANTFTLSFWVLPHGTNDLPVEQNSGVKGTTTKKQWAVRSDHASCKYDPGTCNLDDHACAGVSVGTNGIVVYEGSDYYLAPILVYPTAISDWTHVVVVYRNNKPTLYVNGVQVRTGLQSTHIVHPTIIFSGEWWGGWYDGLIDEFRLNLSALEDSEVTTLFNETNTTPAAGLVAIKYQNSVPATLYDIRGRVLGRGLKTSAGCLIRAGRIIVRD